MKRGETVSFTRSAVACVGQRNVRVISCGLACRGNFGVELLGSDNGIVYCDRRSYQVGQLWEGMAQTCRRCGKWGTHILHGTDLPPETYIFVPPEDASTHRISLPTEAKSLFCFCGSTHVLSPGVYNHGSREDRENITTCVCIRARGCRFVLTLPRCHRASNAILAHHRLQR